MPLIDLDLVPDLSFTSKLAPHEAVNAKTAVALSLEKTIFWRHAQLRSLCKTFGHGQCTDPRDRVFALLGLVNSPHELGFKADYTITARQTYYLSPASALRVRPSESYAWMVAT